jgi:hypothetical protein
VGQKSETHNDNQNQEAGVQPLILDFLEVREGAASGTTSGTWGDIDGADTD